MQRLPALVVVHFTALMCRGDKGVWKVWESVKTNAHICTAASCPSNSACCSPGGAPRGLMGPLPLSPHSSIGVRSPDRVLVAISSSCAGTVVSGTERGGSMVGMSGLGRDWSMARGTVMSGTGRGGSMVRGTVMSGTGLSGTGRSGQKNTSCATMSGAVMSGAVMSGTGAAGSAIHT